MVPLLTAATVLVLNVSLPGYASSTLSGHVAYILALWVVAGLKQWRFILTQTMFFCT
jgi:hypothetical protein